MYIYIFANDEIIIETPDAVKCERLRPVTMKSATYAAFFRA